MLDYAGDVATFTAGPGPVTTASFVPGEYEGDWNVEFEDGDSSNMQVDFDEHGQTLVFIGGDNVSCYQEGAGVIAFLHQIDLNMPDTGEFACVTAEGAPASNLSLDAAGGYNINGQSGTFEATTTADSDYSELYFINGPLEGAEAEYYEIVDNGLQSLDFYINEQSSNYLGTFTSSSTSSLMCSSQSTPKPFVRYGSAAAPAVPVPQQSINDIFFF